MSDELKAFHVGAKYWVSDNYTWTANGTQVVLLGGIPPGIIGKYRINRAWILASAVPSDADGTMLLNLIVYDLSEGADDTIITSADMETLIVAGIIWYAL